MNATVKAFGRSMHCVATHEREAVEFMCLLLYSGGVLQPYTKGNKRCRIDVECDDLDGSFNCWYSKRDDPTHVSFKLEALFVKRVCDIVIFVIFHEIQYYTMHTTNSVKYN